MKIGYCRVSTGEQNLDLQVDALEKAGCTEIHRDTGSGAHSNPGLIEAMSRLRAGDVLVTWRLDRISRRLRDMLEIAAELDRRQVHLESLMDQINTQSIQGKFFFHLMGSIAELERCTIIQRTQAGLEAARARGRVGGRPRLMTKGKIQSARKLLEAGIPVRDVAKNLGVSLATLYRHVPATSRS